MLRFVPVGEDAKFDRKLYDRVRLNTRRRVVEDLEGYGVQAGQITPDGFELVGPADAADAIRDAVARHLMRGTEGFSISSGGLVREDAPPMEISPEGTVVPGLLEEAA